MKKIGIMADSHSGILKQEAEELDIHVLPMPFYLNGELFHEDLDFSRTGFYEKLREGADVSTSQPSPQEVMEMWDEMLLSYDQILYIPLSSSLSGSCMTAAALSQEPSSAFKFTLPAYKSHLQSNIKPHSMYVSLHNDHSCFCCFIFLFLCVVLLNVYRFCILHVDLLVFFKDSLQIHNRAYNKVTNNKKAYWKQSQTQQ